MLKQYLQDQTWTTGLAADIGGGLMMIFVVTRAPISVVQPISSSGLAVLAVFSHFYLHEHMALTEWASVALSGLGIVIMGVTAAEQPPTTGASLPGARLRASRCARGEATLCTARPWWCVDRQVARFESEGLRAAAGARQTALQPFCVCAMESFQQRAVPPTSTLAAGTLLLLAGLSALSFYLWWTRRRRQQNPRGGYAAHLGAAAHASGRLEEVAGEASWSNKHHIVPLHSSICSSLPSPRHRRSVNSLILSLTLIPAHVRCFPPQTAGAQAGCLYSLSATSCRIGFIMSGRNLLYAPMGIGLSVTLTGAASQPCRGAVQTRSRLAMRLLTNVGPVLGGRCRPASQGLGWSARRRG